jgi:hypothetical protein
VIAFNLAIRVLSEANVGQHWATRGKRTREHRGLARVATVAATTAGFREEARRLGVVVVLCRISPGTLDTDNLARAFKACRDGVADGLGFPDDNHPALDWRYAQARGAPGQYGVRVALSLRSGPTGG